MKEIDYLELEQALQLIAGILGRKGVEQQNFEEYIKKL